MLVEASRPNFLIIMTDEQPVQTVSGYGYDWVNTPNLDRLAQQGVLFTRAYTSAPVCTPARASLFSGIYSHNTGAWANHLALGQDIKTIGHHFQQHGYRTVYIGKWHLDGLDYFGTGECPAEFEEGYWYDGRRHLDYLGPEKSHLWRSQSLDTVEAQKEQGIDREFTWAGHVTDRALGFMDDSSGDCRPWVLIVSYDEPHHPWLCPPEFLERFEGADLPVPETFHTHFENKPAVHKEWSEWWGLDEESLVYNQRLTFAITEFVDSEIGKVLGRVDRFDNTHVLFTSDHGNQLGAQRLMCKGPWMYEESIRVPLIIRGPSLEKGRIEDQIVSHIDILPTLMDLSGMAVPPILDGNTFAGLVRDDRADGDREQHPARAIVEFNRFQLERDDFGAFYPIRCMVTDHHKLVISLFDSDELYNLQQDPLEQVNLIGDPGHAAIREQMHQELLEWMYVRRDAFRSPQWGRRPWSKSRRFATCGGRIRTAPPDGLGPEARGYLTGLPIEYDFQL